MVRKLLKYEGIYYVRTLLLAEVCTKVTIVQNLAFQGGEYIKQGDPVDDAGGDLLHVVAGHVFTGQHTIQGAVLINDRYGRNILLLLQNMPGPIHSDCGA